MSIADLYIPVAVLLGVGIFFALLLPGLSLSLGPKKAGDLSKRKHTAYESGIVAVGKGQRRLPIKFYRMAVLFILFDIDIIFLFPYAIVMRKLGYFGLWSVLLFVVIFVLGDIWVWKKGVLEWE
ncbi:MAG: NADH-quinone oxidoreductase subunit A [Candidatus Promineifilaceae bacterium]